jgi:colanic acid biosynthesis protein WcaH
MSEWIPDDEWATVVESVPIVSVDLVVECPEGVVLGRRENEPVKGEWFVPGGRVRKGEQLREAVHRVAEVELGVDIEIREELGAFEHFYESSEVGCPKHYVANGYHVWTDETIFDADDQHEGMAVFEGLPTDLHEYVEDYLKTAGIL